MAEGKESRLNTNMDPPDPFTCAVRVKGTCLWAAKSSTTINEPRMGCTSDGAVKLRVVRATLTHLYISLQQKGNRRNYPGKKEKSARVREKEKTPPQFPAALPHIH